MQLTSVDPGDSYGGKLVLARIKLNKKGPTDVRMTVSWAGEPYQFAFRVVKRGTPMPTFVAPPPPPPEPAADEAPAPIST